MLVACSGSTTSRRNTAIEIDAATGRISLTLASPMGGAPVEVEGLVPRLRANGRWVSPGDYPSHSTRSASAEADASSAAITLRLEGASSLPDLEVSLRVDDEADAVLARLTARNATSRVASIEGFELGIRPGEGGWVRLGDDATASTQWIQGQNSWSFVGTVRVTPGPTGADAAGRIVPDEKLFQIGNNTLTDGQAIELLLRGRDAIPLSWWNTVLQAPTGEGALLAGAVTAERFKTAVLAGHDPTIAATLPATARHAFTALRIVSGVTGDHVPLDVGAEISSEELVLAARETGLEALATHAALAGARATVLPRSTTAPVPRLGWSSWSDFFTSISEESFVAQARFVAERLAPLGYQVVQLDDGYQEGWGDWRMNAKFPSGHSGVAARIRELGLVPGIWIAPFLVDDDLPLVSEHPDWFVTHADGAPVIYSSPFFGYSRRVIDVTNPGAADFVRSNLARIRDAGFGLVKADFLFGASFEGRHFDERVTGLEAYRRGLALLRDTLGPDVTIIGIAGPWLATAGAVDYYRQSNDVELSGLGPQWPFFESAALGTAARAHVHDVFFRADPDHVIVEPPLSLDEARAVATYVALSGGLWFAGDDLARLPAERLALLTRAEILDIVAEGRAATPLDLLDSAATRAYVAPLAPYLARLLGVASLSEIATPSIWRLERRDGSTVLAIFNWSDDRASRTLSRTQLGLDDRSYAARDLWLGAEATLTDALVLDQPRHSVTLLALEPS